ncbi:tetratricopeptide repeat protein [Erythrobacter dokdonensis]|uniref:Sel1 repeat family protein n=1 Tax=Erythrobacter dokdonensis DSW-74 TaxID=1300349 RepID=A0A1A7BC74_9SPHN|nr:SEL1-like repeat protein [Erythrobacter dokdonensis]OBV10099.1 Sel1 repeat family protein [Erythrobacter dokdonensis DSW-74]
MRALLCLCGLVLATLMLLTESASARERVPLNRDGWRHGAIHNGKQNMPVILPGVARDWAGGCAGKKAADCRKLAEAFTNGSGDIRTDLRIAVGYWLAGCRAGDGAACGEAAAIIRNGSAGYVDFDLAFRTAQSGCESARDAEACALMGLGLYRGQGTARDPARALAMWQAGCASGGMEACRLQASALREAGDLAGALVLARKACDGGAAWGCGQLASAYRLGDGVTADEAAAARFAERGCGSASTSDADACAHHGYYLARTGDAANLERGSRLLTRSCLAGSATGCFEAGELGRRNPAGSKIARWEVALSYRDGCDKSHAPSCRELGALYLQGNGQVGRWPDRAIALIDHACALGDEPACGRARALGPAADAARRRVHPVHPAYPASEQIAAALALVKAGRGQDGLEVIARLMEEGHADASWVLAGWLAYGEPGVIDTPNRAQAIALAENAAAQGHTAAARWVGMAYWEGDGVPVNREKAKRIMQVAMKSGDPLDEALYRSMVGTIERDRQKAEYDRRLAASYRPRSFWGEVMAGLAASVSSYQPSYSSRPSSSGGGWANYVAGASQRDFDSFVRYATGATTVCRSSYC